MVTSASDGASGSGLHAIDCAEMKESHGREPRIIRKRNSEQEATQRVRDNFKGSQWDLERATLKLVDGINLVDRIRRDTKLNRYKKGDIHEKGRIKYFKWLRELYGDVADVILEPEEDDELRPLFSKRWWRSSISPCRTSRPCARC